MKWFLITLAMGLTLAAQENKPEAGKSTPATPAPKAPEVDPKVKAAQEESSELSRALAEGGNSPQDYIRVLEAHLAKHPDSPRRADIEKVLIKSSMEAKDDARIIKYGEKVLEKDPADVQVLDRVARAYLAKGNKEAAEKALGWAKKYVEAVAKLHAQAAPGRVSPGQWADELDRATARGLVMEARANGILGEKNLDAELAKKSFEAYPTAEGAREWARALIAMGNTPEALEHLADAFTIDDPHNTETEKAKDRRLMGELYTKANGSEKGLGDVVLKGYDHTSSLMSDRIARLKSRDPNTQAGGILDFVLPGVNGNDLALASLKGKTVVLDFWATWCGPCKAQRPLYEEVERKFKDKGDVVFLSVNTDEDRTLVAPFVKAQKWTKPVYFDGGLSDYVKVNSIPTTLIVGRNGQVSSRMNGFIPERFVDLLSDRIQDTLR